MSNRIGGAVPIVIRWDGPDHVVVRMIFTGEWQWQDLDAAYQTLTDLLDNADHILDLLVIYDTNRVPSNPVGHFSELANAPFFTHPMSGFVVVVGGTYFLHSLIDLLRGTYTEAASHLYRVMTTDEAYTVLSELHSER